VTLQKLPDKQLADIQKRVAFECGQVRYQISCNKKVLRPIFLLFQEAEAKVDMKILRRAWEDALPDLEVMSDDSPLAFDWIRGLKDITKEFIERKKQ